MIPLNTDAQIADSHRYHLNEILLIVNLIYCNNSIPPISSITEHTNLRIDLGFSSLDLAEFTVRIEERFGVDIFENGIIETISQVLNKINK